MACEFYYFCSDHKCSLAGRYGETISNSTYSSYCKYNNKNCDIYRNDHNKTNNNSNNPNNKNYNGPGCFITTIVCNILGKKDDDDVMKKLRYFRDNVLQNDKNNGKYDDILKKYDTIGPILSNCINKDKNRLNIATIIYNNILTPISSKIEQKRYDEACEDYYIMTLYLINYYGLKHLYNEQADNNYGYTEKEFNRNTSGHGKRKIKILNK